MRCLLAKAQRVERDTFHNALEQSTPGEGLAQMASSGGTKPREGTLTKTCRVLPPWQGWTPSWRLGLSQSESNPNICTSGIFVDCFDGSRGLTDAGVTPNVQKSGVPARQPVSRIVAVHNRRSTQVIRGGSQRRARLRRLGVRVFAAAERRNCCFRNTRGRARGLGNVLWAAKTKTGQGQVQRIQSNPCQRRRVCRRQA